MSQYSQELDLFQATYQHNVKLLPMHISLVIICFTIIQVCGKHTTLQCNTIQKRHFYCAFYTTCRVSTYACK